MHILIFASCFVNLRALARRIAASAAAVSSSGQHLLIQDVSWIRTCTCCSTITAAHHRRQHTDSGCCGAHSGMPHSMQQHMHTNRHASKHEQAFRRENHVENPWGPQGPASWCVGGHKGQPPRSKHLAGGLGTYLGASAPR